MSFNVNPLNTNTPQLRASKSQDGGAGNLGYFQGGKKEEESNTEKSVFGETPNDTFTLQDAEKEFYVEPSLLLKIVRLFQSLFKRLLHQ